MKQSVGAPGRLASAHSVATPLRRKLSGIAEKIVVSISFGGVSRYIIVVGSPVKSARTIMEGCGGVDWVRNQTKVAEIKLPSVGSFSIFQRMRNSRSTRSAGRCF